MDSNTSGGNKDRQLERNCIVLFVIITPHVDHAEIVIFKVESFNGE